MFLGLIVVLDESNAGTGTFLLFGREDFEPRTRFRETGSPDGVFSRHTQFFLRPTRLGDPGKTALLRELKSNQPTT